MKKTNEDNSNILLHNIPQDHLTPEDYTILNKRELNKQVTDLRNYLYQSPPNPETYIISGHRGSGKTTFINQIIQSEVNPECHTLHVIITSPNYTQSTDRHTQLLRHIHRQLYLKYIELPNKAQNKDVLKKLGDTHSQTFNKHVETNLHETIRIINYSLFLQPLAIFAIIFLIPSLAIEFTKSNNDLIEFTEAIEPLTKTVGSILAIILLTINISYNRSNKKTKQIENLYDDEIALYRLLETIELLSKNQIHPIIIIDELDKIEYHNQDTQTTTHNIDLLINNLKPLIHAPLPKRATFILITGQDYIYKLENNLSTNDPIYSRHTFKTIHIPLLTFENSLNLFSSFLTEKYIYDDQFIRNFTAYLAIHSQLIIRNFNNLIRHNAKFIPNDTVNNSKSKKVPPTIVQRLTHVYHHILKHVPALNKHAQPIDKYYLDLTDFNDDPNLTNLRYLQDYGTLMEAFSEINTLTTNNHQDLLQKSIISELPFPEHVKDFIRSEILSYIYLIQQYHTNPHGFIPHIIIENLNKNRKKQEDALPRIPELEAIIYKLIENLMYHLLNPETGIIRLSTDTEQPNPGMVPTTIISFEPDKPYIWRYHDQYHTNPHLNQIALAPQVFPGRLINNNNTDTFPQKKVQRLVNQGKNEDANLLIFNFFKVIIAQSTNGPRLLPQHARYIKRVFHLLDKPQLSLLINLWINDNPNSDEISHPLRSWYAHAQDETEFQQYQDIMVNWLRTTNSPHTQFVINAWLSKYISLELYNPSYKNRFQPTVSQVLNAAIKWLQINYREKSAIYLLNSILNYANISGEPETLNLFKNHFNNWLEMYDNLPQTHIIYHNFLTPTIYSTHQEYIYQNIAPRINNWLEFANNDRLPDARYIYPSWIDRTGDLSYIDVITHIKNWLSRPTNQTLPNASYVYSALLETQKFPPDVQEYLWLWDSIHVWLQTNSRTKNASFIFQPLILYYKSQIHPQQWETIYLQRINDYLIEFPNTEESHSIRAHLLNSRNNATV